MTKKTFFCTTLLILAIFGFVPNLQAQVTVGSNTEPKATLDVVATASDATLAGIIAPRMDRAYLISKDGTTHTDGYKAAQTGAIVYVTSANGTASAQTSKITEAGYYHFDGTEWKALGGGGGGDWSTNFIVQNTQMAYSPLPSVFSALETVILCVGSNSATVTLPDLSLSEKGKRVYVTNNVSSGNVPLQHATPNEIDGEPLAGGRTYTITTKSTQGFYWAGKVWIVMGK